MSPAKMTPCSAIEKLPGLLAKLDQYREAIARQSAECAASWQQLGRIGAQREDHAAKLLANVGAEMESLRRFAEIVVTQIADLQANPFAE